VLGVVITGLSFNGFVPPKSADRPIGTNGTIGTLGNVPATGAAGIAQRQTY